MTERFDEILEEAAVLRELDAARAEVWVSGLLAEFDDPAVLLALLSGASGPAAVDIASALAGIDPAAREVATALAATTPPPPWAEHVGTAQAHQAWEIVDPFSGNASVVIEYEHADLVRHSMLVEIEDGLAVDIHFGPPSLVDDAFAESDTRSLSVREWPVDRAVDAIAAALRATMAAPDAAVTDELVMNVALAAARVGAGDEGAASSPSSLAAGTGAADPLDGPVVPARTRSADDAEADAAACATLRAALARQLAAPAPAAAVAEAASTVRAALALGATDDLAALAQDAAIDVAHLDRIDDESLLLRLGGAFVVPGPLLAFGPAEREAIRSLEWADWLGAVIPLVRAGVGADSDPAQLVHNINRCPEVTTTVPKRDIPVVAAIFGRMLHAWELTGAVDDQGRLTELGVWLVPRSLLTAWGGAISDR